MRRGEETTQVKKQVEGTREIIRSTAALGFGGGDDKAKVKKRCTGSGAGGTVQALEWR
jgi:hypothetical protein